MSQTKEWIVSIEMPAIGNTATKSDSSTTNSRNDQKHPSTHVWDSNNGSTVVTLKNSAVPHTHAVCKTSSFLFTLSQNAQILNTFSFKKNTPLFQSKLPEKILALECSGDEKFLVGGSVTGRVYIWEIASGYLLKNWSVHYGGVKVLKFTSDDTFLVTAGEDGAVNVFDFVKIFATEDVSEGGEAYHVWAEHSLPILDLHVGWTGTKARIYSVSLDRTCRVYDIATRQTVGVMIFACGLNCVVADPLERYVFVGGVDGKIYLISLFNQHSISPETLAELDTKQMLIGHTQAVTKLLCSFNSNLLMSGSLDGTVRVWDIQTQQTVRVFKSHKGPIGALLAIHKPTVEFEAAQEKTLLKSLPPVQPLKNFAPPSKSDRLVTVLFDYCDPEPTVLSLQQSRHLALDLFEPVDARCRWLLEGEHGSAFFKKKKQKDTDHSGDEPTLISGVPAKNKMKPLQLKKQKIENNDLNDIKKNKKKNKKKNQQNKNHNNNNNNNNNNNDNNNNNNNNDNKNNIEKNDNKNQKKKQNQKKKNLASSSSGFTSKSQ